MPINRLRFFLWRVLRKIEVIVNPSSELVDISDEYVRWLRYANPGMLTPGNLNCFDYAIRNLPTTSPIIEIGSFAGLSANLISYYKWKNNVSNKLITCDKWYFETAIEDTTLGDTPISHHSYRQFVKNSYIRNIKMFSLLNDLPYTIEATSDEFFGLWFQNVRVEDILGRIVQLGGRTSFCYIDGNHSYQYVKRDFQNCDKILDEGGFILFDDSADYSGWEVCQVIDEIKHSKRYRVILKNPNYLFQKLLD